MKNKYNKKIGFSPTLISLLISLAYYIAWNNIFQTMQSKSIWLNLIVSSSLQKLLVILLSFGCAILIFIALMVFSLPYIYKIAVFIIAVFTAIIFYSFISLKLFFIEGHSSWKIFLLCSFYSLFFIAIPAYIIFLSKMNYYKYYRRLVISLVPMMYILISCWALFYFNAKVFKQPSSSLSVTLSTGKQITTQKNFNFGLEKKSLAIIVIDNNLPANLFHIINQSNLNNTPLSEIGRNIYAFNNFRYDEFNESITNDKKSGFLAGLADKLPFSNNSVNYNHFSNNIAITVLKNNNNNASCLSLLPESKLCKLYCTENECSDDLLLEQLEAHIEKNDDKNHLILLKMKPLKENNYKNKYMASFWRPDCSKKWDICSSEEQNNTINNAIIYSDSFFNKVIRIAKKYDKSYKSLFFYLVNNNDIDVKKISYIKLIGDVLKKKYNSLNSIPKNASHKDFIHSPLMIWLSESVIAEKKINISCLKKNSVLPYNYQNITNTILGFLDNSDFPYDKNHDMLSVCSTL